MTREQISKLLSGSLIMLCLVLVLAPGANAQFGGGIKTFVVSGNAGAANVTLRGFPDGPIKSDSGGNYSVVVSFGWSGLITPDLEGYTFSPPNMKYEPVREDKVGQDFVATIRTYKIAGTVGRSGVMMDGFPDGPVSVNEKGQYEVIVPYGWASTVTPLLDGFTFNPPSRSYPQVNRDMTTENYTAEKLMYEIAGTVQVPGGPVAGVVMKGLPGDPITGPDGRYVVKVDYNWQGTITPSRDGYVFDPPIKPYDNVNMSMTAEDFYGNVIQYTISGTVGIGGAKLNGLPGNVVSGADGYYSALVNYGFTGKITPALDGYRFNPPDRPFQKVTADVIGQDFEAEEITVRITGSVGQPNVQMQGLTTPEGQTVVSDERGRYEAVVSYNWYGEVRPIQEGYTFSPATIQYEGVTRDRITENYRATRVKHVFSGRIDKDGLGEEGIELKGFGTRVSTNAVGEFRTQVPFGWSGTITPLKGGLEFNPPSIDVVDVRQDMPNQDFSAREQRFTISGRIMSVQGPVEGATVMSGLGSEVQSVTDSDGKFSLTVKHGWTGKVSFFNDGFTFEPPVQSIQRVIQDMTLNIKAKVKMFKIEGEIIIMGQPVTGVKIEATNGGSTDMTDSRGRYTIEVPYNWSGDLIPTKEGWDFDPPSLPYELVREDYNTRAEQPSLPGSSTMSMPPRPTGVPEDVDPFASGEVDPFASGEVNSSLDASTQEQGVTGGGGAEDLEKQTLRDQLEETQRRLQDVLSGAGTGSDSKTGIAATAGGLAENSMGNRSAMPEGKGPAINNTFMETELAFALHEIATDAGVTIVVDPLIQGLISADLQGVPLESALDIILAGSGFSWKKTPYYYLVSSVDVSSLSFMDGSVTRQVKMRYIDGMTASMLLNTAFKRYVQAENRGRLITITAPASLADRIVEDLQAMDNRPRQVLLDARIVAMEKGDLLNIGVEWGWPKTSVGMFGSDHKDGGDPLVDFGGMFPWGVQVGYSPDSTFTNALTMQLNLMVENEEASIVSNPQVMAQDTKPAEIRVVREEYYMMIPPESVGAFAYSRAELEKIESGTVLEITPFIADNNDIELLVAAELSDSVPKGRGSDLPVITRRSTRNSVTIQDGGTVAIAGLQTNQTVKNNKSVPGLSKLPLIGKLFSNDSDNGTQRDIAIFITARLVAHESSYNRNMQQQNPGTDNRMMQNNMLPANTNPYMQQQMPQDDFQQQLRNELMAPRP